MHFKNEILTNNQLYCRSHTGTKLWELQYYSKWMTIKIIPRSRSIFSFYFWKQCFLTDARKHIKNRRHYLERLYREFGRGLQCYWINNDYSLVPLSFNDPEMVTDNIIFFINNLYKIKILQFVFTPN